MQGVFSLSFVSFFEKIDEFFTPTFDTYEHLTFLNDPNAFKWLVLGIYFGLLLASFVMFYNKNVLGAFVRRIDGAGALDAASAKTLAELGFEKNIFIKLSLKLGNSLRRVIALAPKDGEEHDGDLTLFHASMLKQKYSLSDARFYIPQTKRDIVVGRFSAKGSGILSVVLTAVIGLAVAIIILKFAPNVAGLIESVIDGMSPADPLS